MQDFYNTIVEMFTFWNFLIFWYTIALFVANEGQMTQTIVEVWFYYQSDNFGIISCNEKKM